MAKTPFGIPYIVRSNRGHPVFLHAWATWCPTCRQADPVVSKVLRELRPQGLRVVSLSLDRAVGPVNAYLKRHPTPWGHYWIKPHREGALRDALSQVGAKFSGMIPYSAVFNGEGRLVKQWVGGRSAEHYRAALLPVMEASEGTSPEPEAGDEVSGWVLQEDGTWLRP